MYPNVNYYNWIAWSVTNSLQVQQSETYMYFEDNYTWIRKGDLVIFFLLNQMNKAICKQNFILKKPTTTTIDKM